MLPVACILHLFIFWATCARVFFLIVDIPKQSYENVVKRKFCFVSPRQMVLRVILELFKTGPALDGLLEDLPEIMGVVATMAEEDGKFVNSFQRYDLFSVKFCRKKVLV